jgi:PAS domain S-box-containing protein
VPIFAAVGVYTGLLIVDAFVAAVCAGYTLAQSPRKRATQLGAALAAGAAWWAFCEACWNSAQDPATALFWMRMAMPGWVFLGGLAPHLMGRYLDLYPSPDQAWKQRLLLRTAWLGYATGLALIPLGASTRWVYGELIRVPWGWTYAPGAAQMIFLALAGVPLTLTVWAMVTNMQSPLAVAPRAHRILIRVGILTPVLLTPLTDVLLPAAGIHFPRLGSTAYALLGLVGLGSGLHFGISFFTPRQFSEEILETLHEGVAMITPRGLIRRANRSFARLCGTESEALIGTPLARVLSWQPGDATEEVDDVHAELRCRDGSAVPVAITAAPLRDQRANVLGIVVVVRDRREIEELRRRMLTQARLAAVGELAAGLAHEMNNPLAYVRSNLALLERHWKTLNEAGALSPEDQEAIAEETRELIGESLVGVDRAAEIVRGVRHFTHAGHPLREHADLNALLEDAVAMVRSRLHPDLTLELHPGALPPIRCAPQELRQVFLNLLVNALDAVGTRGHVAVRTRLAGDEVIAEVQDDGCGMTPDVIERIFDPFFTTKRVGEGTGLGLGIAWHIVHAHGGRIVVESTPGAGTTFRVHLPVEAPSPA